MCVKKERVMEKNRRGGREERLRESGEKKTVFRVCVCACVY